MANGSGADGAERRPAALSAGKRTAASADAARRDSARETDRGGDDEEDWVFEPIWWLDGVLTAAYFLEVYWLAFHVLLPRQDEDGRALLGTVAALTLAAAVAIHAVMVASESAGRWLSYGPLRRPPFDRPLRSRKNMHKFKAQMWQLVVHTIFAVLEWRVLHDEPWFEEGWRAAVPSPHVQTNKPELRQLYLAQLAVWIYMGACQLYFLEKQKDYYVMMWHHVITLALVGLSFHHNYVRYGVMVLFVHDASDIFLDLMKTANYLRLEDRAGCYLVEMFYASCFVSWPYFRLYQLPKMIWSGTSLWLWWFLPDRADLSCPPADSAEYPGVWEACTTIDEVVGRQTVFASAAVANTLLCVLVCLHVWWNGLLIKGGYDVLFAPPGQGSKFHRGFAKHYEGGDEDKQPQAVKSE